MILPPIERGHSPAPVARAGHRDSFSREPDRSTSFKGTQLKNQIKAKFHELDVNKDGALSFQELVVFLNCLSSKLTEKEVQQIFRRMDRNRDEVVQFDEFVDFIFSSDMDKNPRLRADVEAAAKRSLDHVSQLEGSVAQQRHERQAAEKSGRKRLGALEGKYLFSWDGEDDCLEKMELELSERGTFSFRAFSQLDKGMTDIDTSQGVWEVSATEPEVLLYKEVGPVERLRLAAGELDTGKVGPLSKQRLILRDGCLE
ncbi:unnamed protein product [Effrenium voratum]|nr:unnamed protein product [Effrenium voratum]